MLNKATESQWWKYWENDGDNLFFEKVEDIRREKERNVSEERLVRVFSQLEVVLSKLVNEEEQCRCWRRVACVSLSFLGSVVTAVICSVIC